MANLRANKIVGIGSTDAGVTFNGPISLNSQGYMYFPTGNTANRGRGRGFFLGGGYPAATSRISSVQIQSMGNTTRFGGLTRASTLIASLSSSTRGFSAGAYPSATNVIDFFSLSTSGENAQDFGDLTQARWNFLVLVMKQGECFVEVITHLNII